MSAKTKHHKVSVETAHYKFSALPISTQGADVSQPVFIVGQGRGMSAEHVVLSGQVTVGQPVTVGQLAATEAADLVATLGEIIMPRPASPRTEPPGIPEFLVCLCCTKKRYRDKLLGDLDEDFQHDLSKGMTIARARRKYFGGAIRSIIPQLWAAAKRVGIFGFIAYYARRLLQ